MSNETPHEALGPVLQECARSMPQLLPRLSSVIKDREEDFLRLGAAVFGINSLAGTFSAAATQMASSVGEGALHAAIADLEQQAAEARTVFASVSSAEQLDGMTEVLRHIRTLDLAMGRFTTLVRTLKVLEITTRIESARLGSSGAGFTTLADDVRALGGVIEEHTSKIGDQSALLMNQVAAALERGRKQISAQEKVVADMFDRLFSGIAELEAMRAESAGLVVELARGSRQVTESMGHVIASVQFHDITRQQVEHVEEILEQARGEIDALPEDGDRVGLGAWVRDVLRLQAPLLGQAEDMFRRAVEEFIGNLDAIADNTRGLDERISAVAYADRGGPSVLDTIRRHIAQVMDVMRTTSAHVAEMSRTMAGMAETIATVSTFVHGIEDIGAEIELIALNARVKAAHTGDLGRTLGVIAMEIQNLSVEARTRTGEVAEILNRISALAGRLSDLARASDVTELTGGIRDRFETVLDRLAGLDSELGTDIGRVSDLGQGLVAQIRTLTASIHFHETVSHQLKELTGTVRELESAFTPFAAALDAARQPDKLREQLSRYTMDSERLVHLAVLGQHDDGAGPADDVELFGDDGVELFDDGNVELFGDDNVELFDAPEPEKGKKTDSEDDFGDNVELF
jgi:methyl-accepting chemotaxis protein/outer membrane murein-binding lipoprotein Lpp